MALLHVSTSFERVAELVTARVAELLSVPVWVVDGRGKIVSSTDASCVGLASRMLGAIAGLRLPLSLEGHVGEVVVGEPAGDEVFAPRLVEALIELVVTQATFVTRSGILGDAQHDLRNRFLGDLLRGELHDEEATGRDAKLLGLDFAPPRAVLLIDAADFILDGVEGIDPEGAEPHRRRRAQMVIGTIVSFFHLPNDTICAYLGDGEIAVLKASNTKNLSIWSDRADGQALQVSSWADLSALRRAGAALADRLRADTGVAITIGIGRYHPGVFGLSRSYQDARAALLLGRRFHGQNGVHCLDQLGIAAFVGVSDERTKIDLATYLLSPLDHEPDLLETLDVFFAHDCSPSATAARMSIHRNTLSYRCDKVASLTGLDPRRFDDAVQIRLALLLRAFNHSVS